MVELTLGTTPIHVKMRFHVFSFQLPANTYNHSERIPDRDFFTD